MVYRHGEVTSKENALPVDLEDQGTVSALNSTSTPLDADASFTGEWEDIKEFQTILISGGSDVAGTLYAEVSTNKKGNDEDKTIVQLSTGLDGNWGPHSLIRISRYFRIRVVNGSVAQTAMQVQVIFGQSSSISIPTSRASQQVTDFTDVLNVREITDPHLDEASGLQRNRSIVHKFGRNPSIQADSTEHIDVQGGNVSLLTAAETLRIKAGGDAADDSTGLGARTIMLEGLDENFEEITETLTTNGASVSTASTATFIRLNRAYVVTSGTYGEANTGDVFIETSTGNQLGQIAATKGQTEMCHYCVPVGKTAYVREIQVNVESAKPADLNFWHRDNANVVTAPFTAPRVFYVVAQLTGHLERRFRSYPGPFLEKTDLYVTGTTPVGNATSISASYDLIMVDTNF